MYRFHHIKHAEAPTCQRPTRTIDVLCEPVGTDLGRCPARSEEACAAEIPTLPQYFAIAEANAYPYTYFSFWHEPPGFQDAIARQDYDNALQILQALSPIDRVEGWLRIVQADSFQGNRAQLLIAQNNADAGLKVVRALPIEGDRASALAGVAIALHNANQADLAHQALAEATAIARTLPNHIGKTQVLLDISQTWIDLDQLTPAPDLLTQAAAIWK